MKKYLIFEDQLEKLGINEHMREDLERIFDYTSYSDMEIELENRGIPYDEKLLKACEDFVLTKLDDDRTSELVEFLIYKGRLNYDR